MSTPQSVRRWGWFEGLPLQTQDVDGTDGFDTLRRFIVRPRCLEYQPHVIPAGTRSNGESSQRWMWSIIGHPFRGPTKPAAVAHDRAYGYHELIRLNERGMQVAITPMSRRLADQMYYELLRARGMTWLRARMRYYGLRLFGARYW